MLKKIKEEVLDKFNLVADQLLIIELLFFKEYSDLDTYIPRLASNYDILMQNLLRRDFIKYYNDNLASYRNVRNISLTLKGENVLKALRDITPDNDSKVVITVETYFNEFWDKFPSSDKWNNFPSTRALKSDKNGCNKRYNKLLLEEGYNHTDIIKALDFQIRMFKKNSTVVENKLKFFQNSSTWLNQKTFLEYLELMKEESIEDEPKGLIL